MSVRLEQSEDCITYHGELCALSYDEYFGTWLIDSRYDKDVIHFNQIEALEELREALEQEIERYKKEVGEG